MQTGVRVFFKYTLTHMLGLHVLWGRSIDIDKLSAFLHFQKTLLSMINDQKCPHKDKDFCYCHLCGDISSP